MPLLILEKGSNPLFGRNWLQQFKLPWFEIKAIKTSLNETSSESSSEGKRRLAKLLVKHNSIFSEGVGNIESY